MNKLKDQLSSYIQFVFDNEKSFIETFTKQTDRVIDIDFFYMGSGHHIVRFNCETNYADLIPSSRIKRIILPKLTLKH